MTTEPSPWLRLGAQYVCFHCNDRAFAPGPCATCGTPRLDLERDPRATSHVLTRARRLGQRTSIAREMRRARWLQVFTVAVHLVALAIGVVAAMRAGRIDTHGFVPKSVVRALGLLLGYAGGRVVLALGVIVAHAVAVALATFAWVATALGSILTREAGARSRAWMRLQRAFARFTGSDLPLQDAATPVMLHAAPFDPRDGDSPDDETGVLSLDEGVDAILGMAGVTAGARLEDAVAPTLRVLRDDGTTVLVEPAVGYVRFHTEPEPRVVGAEELPLAWGVARRPPGRGPALAPSAVVDTWRARAGDRIALHGGETVDREGTLVRMGTPTAPLWITVSSKVPPA